jgi:hypothetical protein
MLRPPLLDYVFFVNKHYNRLKCFVGIDFYSRQGRQGSQVRQDFYKIEYWEPGRPRAPSFAKIKIASIITFFLAYLKSLAHSAFAVY